jgi:hypothetical protein
MSDLLEQFGEDLKTNVEGFIAVAVAEIKSGITYFSLSIDPSFDPDLVVAFNLEVIKSKLNAISVLELKNQTIDSIMIALTSQIHIIDVFANGEYFLYLAVDSTKVNLGMAKGLLNKYKNNISVQL